MIHIEKMQKMRLQALATVTSCNLADLGAARPTPQLDCVQAAAPQRWAMPKCVAIGWC